MNQETKKNDDEESLTIDLGQPPAEEMFSIEGLEAEFQEALADLEDVSELDANAPYCEPEPLLPSGASIQEKREFKRYLVNWKVAVVNEKSGQDHVFHGRARDISMGGLCLMSDHNLNIRNSVRVLIAVPPNSPKHPPHVVEVRSKLAYTVLEKGGKQFRIGITFLEFKGDGRLMLEKRLAERQSVF